MRRASVRLAELPDEAQAVARQAAQKPPSVKSAWQIRKEKRARKLRKAKADAIRARFRLLCKDNGLPMPVTEYRFHPERMWRWDYAWPDERIALEVDGGLFVNGGHNRGGYLVKLHEKKNAAALMGWRVLYCVPKTLDSSDTIELVRRALNNTEAG